MTLHLHTLHGCSPTPLANYLKALGILRLVGEQADKQARGWWDGEHFCLLTKLSREELEAFFLERYAPTPLLSPWNKGCGFFKANDSGLCPLEESTAPRLERFRDGVVAARQLLNEISQADATIRAIKARTKTTAKGFQSEEQRQLLATNETYRSVLQQLQEQLRKTGLAPEKRIEVESDIATITSLGQEATKPPSRSQAELLKASSGYKRLLAAADRRFKSLKATLIPDCRRLWRGPHADWLSAAVVLDEEGNQEWPSIVGTGGNDSRTDFTNQYMQQLGKLFDLKTPTASHLVDGKNSLSNSLWATASDKLKAASIGQFDPGSAGGANSSTGFESGNLVNPWDYLFTLEGTLLFRVQATRRLDARRRSKLSAPFAVKSQNVGFGSPGLENTQKGEQWLPIWRQPSTIDELAALFGEARAQVDRQGVERSVDMARALSRLGVSRGIEEFVRYGYFERFGQNKLAVPLGRIQVRHHPRAYLVDVLASWMDRLQRRSRDKNVPARLVHAERRLADAVFAALTHDHTPERWQAILLAAADIEALQATGVAIKAQPIPWLHPEWIATVDDGSAEVRLALALGSAAADYFKGRPIDPVRSHWLPLEPGDRRFKATDNHLVNDPRVVASGRDPIRDLAALVDRRLIEAGMNGQRSSRLIAAPGCGARLDDLQQFLNGSLDLAKLLGLARAFMAIRWDRWSKEHYPRASPLSETPDEAWMAIRLANLPDDWINDQHIPAELRIVRLLMSGDSSRAIDVARSRLRSAGIRPPLQAGVTDAATARLWAAALAFPIDWRTANKIAQRLDPRLKPQKGVQHV